MSRFAFELDRADVDQSRVQTLPIVPSLDVLEDNRASLGSRIKLMICTFSLKSTEKAFHSRVVKAIADPTHTDLAMISGKLR
jgi:hypothetical protein